MNAIRRFCRDDRAQAMTEAAIVMPLVLLFFIAAHEFGSQANYKHRVIFASRFFIWETAAMNNHPDHPIPTEPKLLHTPGVKEISAGERNSTMDAVAQDAFDLLFRGADDINGYNTYRPNPPDGFERSFDLAQALDFALSIFGGDMDGGSGGSSGGFDFSDILDIFTADLARLPVMGFVHGGFSVDWDPPFMALLAPGRAGTDGTAYAFYGSAEGQQTFEDADTQAPPGMLRIGIPTQATYDDLGSEGAGYSFHSYARYALYTSDWSLKPGQEQGDLLYHVDGMTIVGMLSTLFGDSDERESGEGDAGFMGDMINDLLSAIVPFQTFVLETRVGASYEGGPAAETED